MPGNPGPRLFNAKRPSALWLIPLLALCALPVAINAPKADLVWHMEKITLLSSYETWVRQELGLSWLIAREVVDEHTDPAKAAALHALWPEKGTHASDLTPGDARGVWFPVPTGTGFWRIHKPPGVIWLNMAAWNTMGFDPATASSEALLDAARGVGVAVLLLMVAGTYVIGRTLGGWRDGPWLGLLAAMIVGTTLMWQRQSAQATYDVFMAAGATLAVAAGLWGQWRTRPPAVWRRGQGWWWAGRWWVARWWLGWLAAGVLAGGTAMLKSLPLGLALSLVPLAALTAVSSGRHARPRWTAAAGLGLALLVALFVAGPWHLYVVEAHDAVASKITEEWEADRPSGRGYLYYLLLVPLVAPWSGWLVGGLIHPFVNPHRLRRPLGRLCFAWLWFVLIFAAFTLHPAKAQRYILPILPAVGLLSAEVWLWLTRLQRHGLSDWGIRVLRVQHWGVMAALSCGFVGYALWLRAAFDAGPADAAMARLREYAPLSPGVAVPITLALLALVVQGARYDFDGRAKAAACLTFAWMLLAGGVALHLYNTGPESTSPYKADAFRVAEAVGDAPMVQLDMNRSRFHWNDDSLFYARRCVRQLNRPQLIAALNACRGVYPDVYVMTTDDPDHDEAMRRLHAVAGLSVEPRFAFHDRPRLTRRLWHVRTGPPATTHSLPPPAAD